MGIAGVLLGIVAAICALLATFLFGTAGGVAAGVLGIVAIVLGFLKHRRDRKGGVAAIVVGALSILLAFSLTSTWSSMFAKLHNKALELKPDGLWAQVSADTNGGIMGVIKNLPQDEATMNALVEEMDELNKLMEPQK